MADEAGGASPDRGGPNGQFTIFHVMILATLFLAVVLPAHDGYKANGLRGLLLGLLGGVFLMAPIGLVMGTVGVIICLGTIFGASRLVEAITGLWRAGPAEATDGGPASPHPGDGGS
jgi:hypothetical protein